MVAGAIAASSPAAATADAITTQARLARSVPSLLYVAATQSSPGLPSFPDIVDAVKPSVIGVRTNASVPRSDRPFSGSPADQPGFFDSPGNAPDTPDPRGHEGLVSQGSGFFISADGYAVTNRHVVEGNETAEVKTDDGRSFTARVIGTDAVTDLALLKIDGGNDFIPVKLADRAPRVGEWVLAIGNPFGLAGTVTAGIVSSDKRNVGAGMQQDLVQIDAPVNQGNSGGPTFDVDGEVIGVNTMIVSPTGGSIGIAFAIPADTVKKVIPQLREHGFVTRGWMGVQLQPVTPEVAESLNLERARGAIVGEVQAHSPAAAAGISTGDIIQSLNGEPINDAQDLARKVGDMRPGMSAKLGIRHGGRQKEVAVTLGELPVKREARISRQQTNNAPPATLGLRLSAAAGNAPSSSESGGVKIVGIEPNGSAAVHGLSVGDVITQVDGQAVGTPEEFQLALNKARSQGKRFSLLQLKSAEGVRFVAVPPDPA
jgi:serine protease Do